MHICYDIAEEEHRYGAIDEDDCNCKDKVESDLNVQDPSSNEVFPEETEMIRTRRKALLCCHPFAVSEAHVRNVTPPVRIKNSPALTFRIRENAETTHSDSPGDGLAKHQFHRKQNTSEGEL